MLNKNNLYKTIAIMIFVLSSCSVQAEDKPEELFKKLLTKYTKSKIEYKDIESNLDDGMSFAVYDVDNNMSEDIFCRVNLLATMGQTQYLCYKKEADTIWHIEKEATIYDAPYTLENAQIEKTYFKYKEGKTFVYNNETDRYNIEKDSGDFIAIVDYEKIEDLIDLIENNL